MTEEQPGDVMDYLAAIPISNARAVGLKMLGLGTLALLVNYFSVMSNGRYHFFLLPLAFPIVLAGVCLAIIRQPRSASGEPAFWGRFLLVASATLGAGLGIVASLMLLGLGS